MESESEGGQKFLPPNPLPFCPPERLDFKIRNSDFRQKMFELRSKTTANALIAQWIERLVAVQKVAGPIPAKRTTKNIIQNYVRKRTGTRK